MAQSFINNEVFKQYMIKKVNEELLIAAEPILQESLKKIEVEMRKQLATNLISLVEHSFSFERYGTDIRIIVSGAIK